MTTDVECCDHGHEALAQANGDPTRTTTLRRRYAQRLRGAFAGINTEIRRGLIDRDAFGLADIETLRKQYERAEDRYQWEKISPEPTDEVWLEYLEGRRDIYERVWKRRKKERLYEGLATEIPFQFPADVDDSVKIERFMSWLRTQLENDVLTVIQRNNNTYIRSAYGRGLDHAASALREAGVDVTEPELQAAFNLPIHQESLQLLFTRNYAALEGITDEVAKQIADELTTGFSQGLGPREMARNITDRVDKIGKTRATTLARTEVINAHSQATLNRYERMGVDGVTVQAEFTTAGDNRVCPLCASLEGRTFTIEEARSETFRYEADDDEPPSLSGTYNVRPPIHPNCRCAWLPVVS